mmetsp:Transcript_6999/g.22168  ORF Transcript_6999/g.22168 Transcript_6999/m.22168 type:complete len:259 (+) Transcript_6999:374-1150(+)
MRCLGLHRSVAQLRLPVGRLHRGRQRDGGAVPIHERLLGAEIKDTQLKWSYPDKQMQRRQRQKVDVGRARRLLRVGSEWHPRAAKRAHGVLHVTNCHEHAVPRICTPGRGKERHFEAARKRAVGCTAARARRFRAIPARPQLGLFADMEHRSPQTAKTRARSARAVRDHGAQHDEAIAAQHGGHGAVRQHQTRDLDTAWSNRIRFIRQDPKLGRRGHDNHRAGDAAQRSLRASVQTEAGASERRSRVMLRLVCWRSLA